MIVLGSTGSIGVNTLNIARKFNLNVEVLCTNQNIQLLNNQISEFNPSFVIVGDKSLVNKVNHSSVYFGIDGIIEVLNKAKSDLVVNALVGFFGLKPTLEAIKLNKKIALANKESLVVGGAFVDISKISPIDSEHFGLWYLLGNRKIDKMTITASGGAFRDYDLNKLSLVTPKEALRHPNWSMGQKITIDSATMTNKLFELLEARWLFDVENLDAIIETKSLIHALIDFVDGSTTAHLAITDMKLPIAYAIFGEIKEQILQKINLLEIKSLEFREIKSDRYPIWEIKEYILKNPHLGVIINAANEIAVELFLKEKIRFLDIANITINALKKFEFNSLKSLDEIFEIDKEIRVYSRNYLDILK